MTRAPEAVAGVALPPEIAAGLLPLDGAAAGLSSLAHAASTLAKPAPGPDPFVDGTTRASPAAQAAPALLSLATRAGTSELNLKLTPDELGHMHVRITRDEAGGASVSVTAERPETLALLVSDQAALHRALDKAGVSAQDRSLTFHLGAPDKPAVADVALPSSAADVTGRGGNGAQGFSQRQGGGEHGATSGESGQQRRDPSRAEAGWTAGGNAEQSAFLGATPQSARGTVDITA